MRTSDKLTPLHQRRAEGETKVGTRANPPAVSSNPAVARFKRGGSVSEAPMGKVKATTTHEDDETREMSKHDKKGGPIHRAKGGKAKAGKAAAVSREDVTGVGALSKPDMRGGALPQGDEFKKGGKAKHKYAKGGHIKSSGDKFHHPQGHESHSGKHAYAEGGSVTKGVNRW